MRQFRERPLGVRSARKKINLVELWLNEKTFIKNCKSDLVGPWYNIGPLNGKAIFSTFPYESRFERSFGFVDKVQQFAVQRAI